MVVGGALVLLAVAILFTALDLPVSALIKVAVWSPAILCMAALLLLFVSAGPRRVVVTALALLLTGCLGLVATHRLVAPLFWWTFLAGILGLIGLLLTVSGLRASEHSPQLRSPGAPVVRWSFWRSKTLDPVPDDASAVAVTVCMADVVIDLPHAGVKTIELDVSILFGGITVRVPRMLQPSEVVIHRAFLLTAGKLRTALPSPPTGAGMPPALSVGIVGVGGDVVVRHELDLDQPQVGEKTTPPGS